MKLAGYYRNITPINFNFTGKKVNVLAYNDVHGATEYIDSFIAEQDKFYKQNPDNVNLTLCGGDLFLDKNKNNEIVARKAAGQTDAISVGNHDLDGGNYLGYLIKKFNLKDKFLSINIKYNRDNELSDTICKSRIIEKNGEKIGIIGVSPFEFKKVSFVNKSTDFINMDNFENTLRAIKTEVAKFKEKGINIIFLLAHTGEYGQNKEKYYEEFAKIGDIDVIVGGHDHREVDRWSESDTGEPVKIISTGRSAQQEFGENLDIVAELNLEFDDNGVLIKEKSKSLFTHLKPDEHTSKQAIRSLHKDIETMEMIHKGNTQIGNLIADSNLWYVNKYTKGEKADFSFVNSGTIRKDLPGKNISIEDIRSVVPFVTATLLKTTLTKKQILDTLNYCALSTSFKNVTPGVMIVSGMEYTINPDLSVSDVHILNKDGSIKYNLDDYDDDKTFIAVYDKFLATGPIGLTELIKDYENNPDVELFNASRQDALLEYLQKCPKLYDYTQKRIKKS